jgi:hypothetical protein
LLGKAQQTKFHLSLKGLFRFLCHPELGSELAFKIDFTC